MRRLWTLGSLIAGVLTVGGCAEAPPAAQSSTASGSSAATISCGTLGVKLAFAGSTEAAAAASDVYMTDGTGAIQQVTRDGRSFAPSFSGTGASLVLKVRPVFDPAKDQLEGPWSAEIVDVKSRTEVLTARGTVMSSLALSPDGAKLAIASELAPIFSSSPDSVPELPTNIPTPGEVAGPEDPLPADTSHAASSIWIGPVSGGDATPALRATSPDGFQDSPDWSTRGDLAFVEVAGAFGVGRFETSVRVVRSDGSAVSALLPATTESVRALRWLTDTSSVYAILQDQKRGLIYGHVDVATSLWVEDQELGQTDAVGSVVALSPDGTVFTARPNKDGLYLISVLDSTEVLQTELRTMHAMTTGEC